MESNHNNIQNQLNSFPKQRDDNVSDIHYALLRVLCREPLLEIFNAPQGSQLIGCPLLKTHSTTTTYYYSNFFNETIVTLVFSKVNTNVHRKHHKENPNKPTLPKLFTAGHSNTNQITRSTHVFFLAPSITPPKRTNQ